MVDENGVDINEVIDDSLNDFCFEQYMAKQYLRGKISPDEQRAYDRMETFEIITGALTFICFVVSIIYYCA